MLALVTAEDNHSRRAFLKAGALATAGLALPDVLRQRALAGCSTDAAVILVFLSGGPSQLDTFDPKPDAPADYRSPFGAIRTRLPGVCFTELFPQLAARADRLSVLRSVCHGDGSHHHSYHWVLTGAYPQNLQFYVNQRPAVGAVAARFRGPNRPGLPAYVSLPRATSYGRAAYLGQAYDPFAVSDPNAPDFHLPNLRLPASVDLSRLDDRRRLLGAFDTMRRDLDGRGSAESMDAFARAAFDLVTGPAAQAAFDLSREDRRLRDRYGRTRLGQSCLLARRLVEAGVTLVAIEDFEHMEWDLHGAPAGQDVANGMRVKGPPLDQAVSALVEDLHLRGLADHVLVVAMGEFGRTPRINGQGGRDHWGVVYNVVLAGGGLRHGQVIGASTSRGERPQSRPLGPVDVLATIYHVLGIDPRQAPLDHTGRPIALLPDATPIRELV